MPAIDFSKVKLIIWDLDDTLWNGTLSEGAVTLNPSTTDLIQQTLDMGIVHSICSKNDFDTAKKTLCSFNLWEVFVFPSITWESKGERIKEIINTMRLRNENTLFVDDNQQNLSEAVFYCPGIQTMMPYELDEVLTYARTMPKNDIKHGRLAQYRLLEQKETVRSKYSSNQDFLMSCEIHVEITRECKQNLERIYELLQRANQLNFTKLRSSKIELINLLSDPSIDCGCVRAVDKFGDYGLVGFFAVSKPKSISDKGSMIHFSFSCRILGMRVEQYIYMKLNCPIINIIGETATKLNDSETPEWINSSTYCTQALESDRVGNDKRTGLNGKILFKGACDMSQMFAYVGENESMITEFTYVGEHGISVEGHNHTAQIVTTLSLSDKRKLELTDEFEWFDSHMFTTSLSAQKFDFVILSMLTDGNCGVYRRKGTNEYVALCEARYDLTDPENWEALINKTIFTSQISFTSDDLRRFSEKYEYIDNHDAGLTMQMLDKLYRLLDSKTQLILILGSEREFLKYANPAYRDRHLIHKTMNFNIKKWSLDKPNVVLMPFDKYVINDEDFLNTINHMTKRVYFHLATDIVDIIQKKGVKNIHRKNIIYLFYDKLQFALWNNKIQNKYLRLMTAGCYYALKLILKKRNTAVP